MASVHDFNFYQTSRLGYDKTDVTFQDLIKISKVDNYIIISFENGKTGLVKCK